MPYNTQSTIIEHTKNLFSLYGYEGFSMRVLERESGIGLSSMYHHYTNKDDLLKDAFYTINKKLGEKRVEFPHEQSAKDMLMSRILFQFEHMADVVFILKYYMHFRSQFPKGETGYTPENGYLHITEVIEHGISTGEFSVPMSDLHATSKTITHTINGYVLEYFPEQIKGAELKQLATFIHSFLLGSLKERSLV